MGIEVKIGANASGFRTGLAQARATAKQFSTDVKGMLFGAFTIAGVLSFAEKMRGIQRDAARLQTSAESVQRIGAAAKRSEVDFEALARSMNKVTLEAAGAAKGGGKAEVFKRLGIDAKEFLGLSMDKKILVLASSFKRLQEDGGDTTAMMELLGARGIEMVPLLAQGPEKLGQIMREATVQTNATVKAFADLDRSINKIKGGGGKFLSWVISKWETVVSHAAADLSQGDFAQRAQGELDAEKLRRKRSGDAAMDDDEEQDFLDTRIRQLKDGAATEALNEIDANDDKESQSGAGESPATDSDATSADRIAALKKSVAEAEARYRIEELEGEARLNELFEQRAAIQSQINEETVEGLEAKKRALALDHEINEEQKKQAENAARAVGKSAGGVARKAKKNAEQADALTEAQTKEADVLERQYLAHASPADRKKYLQNKQDKLMENSKEAESKGDHVGAIKLRTQAEEMQDEIDRSGPKKAVSVSADSLQRVGGGGGIGPATNPVVREQEKTNALLQKLLDEERGGRGGTPQRRDAY